MDDYQWLTYMTRTRCKLIGWSTEIESRKQFVLSRGDLFAVIDRKGGSISVAVVWGPSVDNFKRYMIPLISGASADGVATAVAESVTSLAGEVIGFSTIKNKGRSL